MKQHNVYLLRVLDRQKYMAKTIGKIVTQKIT